MKKLIQQLQKEIARLEQTQALNPRFIKTPQDLLKAKVLLEKELTKVEVYEELTRQILENHV